MLERRGLTGEGAEIGVREGIYAKDILLGWPSCKKLHLIDPWCELPKEEYQDERTFDPEWYDRCWQRMRDFNEQVAFWSMTSKDACKRFAQYETPISILYSRNTWQLPPTLDFVYVDANHGYEHVRDDCFGWWERLSNNGVLAGHDIFNPKCPGVTQAVLEFCQHHKRIAHIVPGDLDQHGKLIVEHSWYIFKGDG